MWLTTGELAFLPDYEASAIRGVAVLPPHSVEITLAARKCNIGDDFLSRSEHKQVDCVRAFDAAPSGTSPAESERLFYLLRPGIRRERMKAVPSVRGDGPKVHHGTVAVRHRLRQRRLEILAPAAAARQEHDDRGG